MSKSFNYWRTDVSARQRAVAPLDVARNEANLYAALLRPGRPLSSIQRIGALMIAFVPLAVGMFCVYSATVSREEWYSRGFGKIPDTFVNLLVSAVVLMTGIVFLYFGLRIAINALVTRAHYK